MHSGIQIRKVTIYDIDDLQRISRQTFSETFAPVNSEKNMTKYLNEALNIKKLKVEINNPNSQFYFAEWSNKILGYLKINLGPSQTELKDEKALGIERIYVLNEFQGRKVGQILFEKAIQIAKQLKVEFIWLGVWEKNHKALNFYTKNGFVPFHKHAFNLGNDEQIDIMMKLPLK